MWLPHTAVVDHFHLVSLANRTVTEARQNRSRAAATGWIAKACAHRMLLLPAGDTVTKNGTHALGQVFANNDATGKLQAVWKVKEQPRTQRRSSSPADAAAAKEELKVLVEAAERPETTKTSSTAPSAGGGTRSKSSSSSALPPARSKQTNIEIKPSNAPQAATATLETTNRLSFMTSRIPTAAWDAHRQSIFPRTVKSPIEELCRVTENQNPFPHRLDPTRETDSWSLDGESASSGRRSTSTTSIPMIQTRTHQLHDYSKHRAAHTVVSPLMS